MLSDVVRRDAPVRLVVFHGLASTPKEFGFLIHPLRREGIRLEALEVPGYSAHLLGEPARWRDWVRAAADALARVTAESPEPFVLGGLCTGAMLAVAVAASRPWPGLRGMSLMSPLVAYDGWGLPRWYALRRLAYVLGLTKRFHMAERWPFGLKNERMRQWIRAQLAAGEDTLVGPPRVPLKAVRESERLSAHVLRLLPLLKVPVLAQHAREDEICSLASARAALSTVPARLLDLQVLDNSYHMITADNDRQLVADRLALFMHSLSFHPIVAVAGRERQTSISPAAEAGIGLAS